MTEAEALQELFDHHGYYIEDPEDVLPQKRGGPPYLEESTDPTAEAYAKKERASVLQAEIAKLPLRYAEVLKLRYGLVGQEMTQQQVAEALGITQQMVSKIELEALKRLRQSRAIQSLAS